MSVRMRKNSSQSKTKRAHHRINSPAITTDEKGTPNLRHRVSPVSGEYRGRKVLDVEKKIIKKQAKKNPQDNDAE